MNDNKSAFHSSEYDKKIRQTLPYYDAFYEQVIELVSAYKHNALAWLDVGCGTGKMASLVFETLEVERFAFCDCSDEMIDIARERFYSRNTEFSVCDVQRLAYTNEFDVVTAIQVNHYLHKDERRIAFQKCYEALKENGLFINFENFAPFSDFGKRIYLEKWKAYQMKQGKSPAECDKHIGRYGNDYFPISITEHIELMQSCGFRAVEILWLSNMQVGIWGIK